jgi:hypothetical protein
MFAFDRESHVDFGIAACINGRAPAGSGIKPEKLCKYKTILTAIPQIQKEIVFEHKISEQRSMYRVFRSLCFRIFQAQKCLNEVAFLNGYKSVDVMLKNDLHKLSCIYEHFLKFFKLLIFSVHQGTVLIISKVPSLCSRGSYYSLTW